MKPRRRAAQGMQGARGGLSEWSSALLQCMPAGHACACTPVALPGPRYLPVATSRAVSQWQMLSLCTHGRPLRSANCPTGAD